MRWGVACVLAVLCACKDPPPGLVIAVEVPPAITADHVRLLVSTTKCTNCAGIAPPNAAAKISGDVRFDDAGQMIVDDDVQKLDVNIARFQLLAPQDTKVHIAAVAFDPSDKPLAAALLDDDLTVTPVGSTLVTMELAAVHDNQVAWWPDLMDAKASCTLLRLPGQPATFFVPTIDPDCDGVLAATGAIRSPTSSRRRCSRPCRTPTAGSPRQPMGATSVSSTASRTARGRARASRSPTGACPRRCATRRATARW